MTIEKEREREREKQTDRQTDRQTDYSHFVKTSIDIPITNWGKQNNITSSKSPPTATLFKANFNNININNLISELISS